MFIIGVIGKIFTYRTSEGMVPSQIARQLLVRNHSRCGSVHSDDARE